MKKCNCDICKKHKVMTKEWIEASIKKANKNHSEMS